MLVYAVSVCPEEGTTNHIHSLRRGLKATQSSARPNNWWWRVRALHECIGPAGFALRWRDPPQLYLNLLLVAVLPYGEECLRDIRWARAARHGRATTTDLSGVSEHNRIGNLPAVSMPAVSMPAGAAARLGRRLEYRLGPAPVARS